MRHLLDPESIPKHREPGVHYDSGHSHTFGIVPAELDGKEAIPFSWASDFPPVGDFVLRFDQYWKADPHREVWVGEEYRRGGIFWCRV